MSIEVWSFRTPRFVVALSLEYERGYQYDGEDPDGETQAKLDSGEYVAFDSVVSVALDGTIISQDWLSGSVYSDGSEREFWQGHRDPNPAHRNCAANECRVGHYFPGMVREAIKEARRVLASAPRLRASALS